MTGGLSSDWLSSYINPLDSTSHGGLLLSIVSLKVANPGINLTFVNIPNDYDDGIRNVLSYMKRKRPP